jgi:hypothetical protein
MEEVKNLEINKRAYSTGKIENFLDRLIRGKGSFVVRKGTEVNELIFDKKLTIGENEANCNVLDDKFSISKLTETELSFLYIMNGD